VDEAYERELARELAQLAARFDEWRAGQISAGELSCRVHQYDKGPSHEMYSLYNLMDQEFVVARAVAESLLSEDESLQKCGLTSTRWCKAFDATGMMRGSSKAKRHFAGVCFGIPPWLATWCHL
jgi:hypothetical protein